MSSSSTIPACIQLPPSLRTNQHIQTICEFWNSIQPPILPSLSTSELQSLAGCIQHISYRRDELIYDAHTSLQYVMIAIRGRVALSSPQPPHTLALSENTNKHTRRSASSSDYVQPLPFPNTHYIITPSHVFGAVLDNTAQLHVTSAREMDCDEVIVQHRATALSRLDCLLLPLSYRRLFTKSVSPSFEHIALTPLTHLPSPQSDLLPSHSPHTAPDNSSLQTSQSAMELRPTQEPSLATDNSMPQLLQGKHISFATPRSEVRSPSESTGSTPARSALKHSRTNSTSQSPTSSSPSSPERSPPSTRSPSRSPSTSTPSHSPPSDSQPHSRSSTPAQSPKHHRSATQPHLHVKSSSKRAGSAKKPDPQQEEKQRLLQLQRDIASFVEYDSVSEIDLSIESDDMRMRRRLAFFRSLPSFSKWSVDRLLRFASTVEDHITSPCTVYRQFDVSTHIYFLYRGSVQLQHRLGALMYGDYYSDHCNDEHKWRYAFARNGLEVMTGVGELRKVEMETLWLSQGKHTVESVLQSTSTSNPIDIPALLNTLPSTNYILLREFDYYSSKLNRDATQHFALHFLHPKHAIRIQFHALKGAVELFVCNQCALPSEIKSTWSASSQTAHTGFNLFQNQLETNETNSLNNPNHRLCELVISPSHHSFQPGWYYITVVGRGLSVSEFQMRTAAVPVDQHIIEKNSTSQNESNSIHEKSSYTSSTLMPLTWSSHPVLPLATLAPPSFFGLEGCFNSCARDEEAVCLSDCFVFAIAKDDFFSIIPSAQLREMIAVNIEQRKHRQQLFLNHLQLMKKTSSDIRDNPKHEYDHEILQLNLSHIEKMEQKHKLLETCLEREADRIRLARLKVRSAAASNGGVAAKRKSPRRRKPSSPSPSLHSTLSLNGEPVKVEHKKVITSSHTTGPSQKRNIKLAEVNSKKHHLDDETMMLKKYLSDESVDQRPVDKPLPLHYQLSHTHSNKVHLQQIGQKKELYGIASNQHVHADMHAISHQDVMIYGDQIAQLALSPADDAELMQAVVPLPSSRQLMSETQSALDLKLANAPLFVSMPYAPPKQEEVKEVSHSQTYDRTSQIFTAHLSKSGEVITEAQLLLKQSSQDVETIENSFEPLSNPSALITIEQESQPTHHTLSSSASTPSLQSGRRQPSTVSPSVQALISSSHSKKVLAIYAVDDPSLNKLKSYNATVEATKARQREFQSAYKVSGQKEKLQPINPSLLAARPSSSLAPRPYITSAPPLRLNASSSTPTLLLMPPQPNASTTANVDSSIFDLTSVDAEQSSQINASNSSDDRYNGSPVDSSNDRTMLSDSLLQALTTATPLDANNSRAQSVEQSPVDTPVSPTRNLVPSSSAPLLPVLSTPSFYAHSGSHPLSKHVHGTVIPTLELQGLSAGPPDSAQASDEELFQLSKPSLHQSLSLTLLNQPSAATMIELAAALGRAPSTQYSRSVSWARLNQDRTQLAALQYDAERQSTPLAPKGMTREQKRKNGKLVSWKGKRDQVQKLVTKQWEEDMAQFAEQQQSLQANYQSNYLMQSPPHNTFASSPDSSPPHVEPPRPYTPVASIPQSTRSTNTRPSSSKASPGASMPRPTSAARHTLAPLQTSSSISSPNATFSPLTAFGSSTKPSPVRVVLRPKIELGIVTQQQHDVKKKTKRVGRTVGKEAGFKRPPSVNTSIIPLQSPIDWVQTSMKEQQEKEEIQSNTSPGPSPNWKKGADISLYQKYAPLGAFHPSTSRSRSRSRSASPPASRSRSRPRTGNYFKPGEPIHKFQSPFEFDYDHHQAEQKQNLLMPAELQVATQLSALFSEATSNASSSPLPESSPFWSAISSGSSPLAQTSPFWSVSKHIGRSISGSQAMYPVKLPDRSHTLQKMKQWVLKEFANDGESPENSDTALDPFQRDSPPAPVSPSLLRSSSLPNHARSASTSRSQSSARRHQPNQPKTLPSSAKSRAQQPESLANHEQESQEALPDLNGVQSDSSALSTAISSPKPKQLDVDTDDNEQHERTDLVSPMIPHAMFSTPVSNRPLADRVETEWIVAPTPHPTQPITLHANDDASDSNNVVQAPVQPTPVVVESKSKRNTQELLDELLPKSKTDGDSERGSTYVKPVSRASLS